MYCSSITLHHADIVEKFERSLDIVVVTYPWNDNHVYSGILPHISMMQQLTLLQTDQKNLIDNFVDRVKVALEEFGVNNE